MTITSSISPHRSSRENQTLAFPQGLFIQYLRHTSNAASLHPCELQALFVQRMTDVSTPHLRHIQQQLLFHRFIRKYFHRPFDEEIEQALRFGDLIAILFAILQRLFHRLPNEIREPIGFGAVDKLAVLVKDLCLTIPGVKYGVCFCGQA